MKKSILVLAAVAAVVTLAKAPAVEARGLRIGFGFGVPFGGRVGMADPSILRRAQDANERIQAREREVVYGRRPVVVVRPSIRHDQAAQAAKAREAKRQEAAAAAAAEAQRQARIAAAAKVETAHIKKKNVQVAKPAVTPTSTVAPIVVAAPAVVAPAAVISGDRQLDAAQQRQNAKADEVLKTLAKPGATPVAAPAAPVVRQTGSDASPFDTGVVVSPVAPVTTKPVVTTATTAPAKEASTGECLRFIPGAGVTVKVSCSE